MSGRKRQKTGMIDNENENNSMAQEIQTPQQTVDAQQVVIPQESERIQRAEWIHEQVKLQREAGTRPGRRSWRSRSCLQSADAP